ncbi:type VII secretion system-associated protein [Nocardia thraciensis]
MHEPPTGMIRLDNWMVLLDPSWVAATPRARPAPDLIVGGWLLDDSGSPGLFQPNPTYRPRAASTPTDPTDAVLRLIATGDSLAEELIACVRDSLLQIGCDSAGVPVIGEAPDGVACVPVVTAELHKARVEVDRWRTVPGSELPAVVPVGADVLLNPGAPAQFRLVTDVLREA